MFELLGSVYICLCVRVRVRAAVATLSDYW